MGQFFEPTFLPVFSNIAHSISTTYVLAENLHYVTFLPTLAQLIFSKLQIRQFRFLPKSHNLSIFALFFVIYLHHFNDHSVTYFQCLTVTLCDYRLTQQPTTELSIFAYCNAEKPKIPTLQLKTHLRDVHYI